MGNLLRIEPALRLCVSHPIELDVSELRLLRHLFTTKTGFSFEFCVVFVMLRESALQPSPTFAILLPVFIAELATVSSRAALHTGKVLELAAHFILTDPPLPISTSSKLARPRRIALVSSDPFRLRDESI